MNGAIVQDLLVAAGGVLRAVTLPAGILLGGGAGAAVLLRSVGMPPTPLHAAAVRLARPLLVLLLLAALPLAVLETLWQTSAPLDSTLLIDLVPYMLSRTLFGVVWAAHVTVLTVCLLRLRAGHPPGLGSSLALLTAWPQIGHLAPNFSIGQSATLFEIGWLAAHRVGAALWVGTLAVLLAWSRPGGPAAVPWARAFFRFAVPGAALLIAGAVGIVLNHGGMEAVIGAQPFAMLVQIKMVLLGVLVVLGALHFRRFQTASARARPSTLVTEVATAAMAVTLGALLGVLPNPAE